MSVIVENGCGWLVCSIKAIQRNYENCQIVEDDDKLKTQEEEKDCNKNVHSYGFKDELFKINSPFMMDTQFEKLTSATRVEGDGGDGCSTAQPTSKKKKRKRSQMNEGELKALEYHNEVKQKISLAHQSLLKAAEELKYFQPAVLSQFDNNCEARKAAMIEGPGNCWVISCEEDVPSTEKEVLYLSHNHSVSECSSLIGRNVKFLGEKAAVLNVGPHTYFIPPDSSFLISNLKYLQEFPHLIDGPFDLIVMDPPWLNKSVKRQKSYWSVTNEDFLTCPIEKFAAPGCIVIVWVTNRQSHQRFVKERLFPKWNVQFEARWHWLKVTTSGEFVYDLDSPHKKPYEALLLGRYKSQRCHNQKKEEQEIVTGGERDNQLPQDKVIISIPCSLHSKKPHLEEILSPYLITYPKCLELFARNLWKGWTSWGNEVLKHQHLDYFQKKEKKLTIQ